jgi:hypothetical protein
MPPAVEVNGARTWKVFGPDLNGAYGRLQGIGGWEAAVRESDGLSFGSIHNYFGDAVAKVSAGGTVSWTATQAGGYGPWPGQSASPLSATVDLAAATHWRGKRADETGFYYLGAPLLRRRKRPVSVG